MKWEYLKKYVIFFMFSLYCIFLLSLSENAVKKGGGGEGGGDHRCRFQNIIFLTGKLMNTHVLHNRTFLETAWQEYLMRFKILILTEILKARSSYFAQWTCRISIERVRFNTNVYKFP